MSIVFNPYLIELIKDALLKSFWRKTALKSFLSSCGVKKELLFRWQEGETKRVFIDFLIPELLQLENGLSIVNTIKQSILEQRSFPDLMKWEDSPEKIALAKQAIQVLKMYIDEQDEQQEDEKAKKRNRDLHREEINKKVKSASTLNSLRESLDLLSVKLGTQEAGYEFQDWFYHLVDFFEIPARKPYSHNGRQIDGSITINDTTYLVELKYTTRQSDATDIDSFFSKVVRKADNTMGIFISMSGYSETAIHEASRDKTPLLLFDYQHVYSLILSGILTLEEVIQRVRRHASQTGEAYLPINKF